MSGTMNEYFEKLTPEEMKAFLNKADELINSREIIMASMPPFSEISHVNTTCGSSKEGRNNGYCTKGSPNRRERRKEERKTKKK